MERVVIFGAGRVGCMFFFEKKNQLNVVAFSDNDSSKWGQCIFQIPIISPQEIVKFEFDRIYIGLYGYRDVDEVRNQLLEMGIPYEKISVEISKTKELERLKKNNYHEKFLVYGMLGQHKENEYEKRWKYLKEKYSHIRIFRFDVDVIGEMMARYFAIRAELQQMESTLDVFLPYLDYKDIVCNRSLVELLRGEIYIPREEEVGFWDYTYRNHYDEIDTSHEDDYNHRDFLSYKTKSYIHEFKLSSAENNKKMERMDIGDRPFVCISNRSVHFYGDNEQAFRNASFADYQAAIAYFRSQGIVSVRMGKFEKPISPIEDVVDYAGLYYDEYMDLYLASKCKAFVCTNSGICALAMMFSVPLLVTNVTPISCGFGGFRYTDLDIYLPKKYYDVQADRFLSLDEMWRFEKNFMLDMGKSESLGIKIMNNTPEEILLAAEELMLRVDGVWVDTKEDKENYEKYLKIHTEMKSSRRPGWKHIGEVPWRISATYLRHNEYLLS